MSPIPPTRTRDQSRTGTPRGKKRWGRRIVVSLVVLVSLAAFSWWIFKEPITRAIVLGQLKEALGVPVEAARVDLLADGSLVLDDVVLRVPSIKGPASELLRAEQIRVELELGADGPVPRRVEVSKPVIRLSRERHSGELNVLGLTLPADDGEDEPLVLPVLEMTDGRLELGEHGPEGYTLLKAIPLVGEVQPLTDAEQGGYSIAVRTPEGSSEAPSVPMQITGRLGERGITLRLDRVRLQEWVPQAVPTAYRELFESLDLRGDVASVMFSAAMDGRGLETQVILDGVRMKLPLDEWLPPSESGEERPVIETAVRTGTLHLNDQGLIALLETTAAGVPMSVHLEHHGLSLDAPFEMKIDVQAYAMPKNPPWLGYLPAGVQRRIRSFSDPTGIFDAQISIARKQGEAKPWVEGDLQFRDAVAAFEGFPYEVRSLAGNAHFDREALVLSDITGRSPQGAGLEVHGRIAPPGPGAEVALDIEVHDVPLDDAMKDAMGPQRRRIVDGLFHQPSYNKLVELGLVGGEMAAGGDENAGGDEVFALGGTSDVSIRIRRALGKASSWQRDIRVTLDQAGFVPEAFPLPVIADDVVIKLDGKTAVIDQGRFRSMTGAGVVDLSAEVDLAKTEHTSMWLSLDAHDIPVDDRLVYAVSNAGAVQRGAAMMTKAVNGLRLEGLVDCKATITTGTRRSTPGENAEYDVAVDLNHLTASPDGGDGSLVIRDVIGTIAANSQRAGVDLQGQLSYQQQDAGRARVSIEVDRQQSQHSDSAFKGDVRATGLDLRAPVEQLVAVFASKTAGAMSELRARYQPTGAASLVVHLEGRGEGVERAAVDVTDTHRAEIDTPMGRVWFTQQSGQLRYVPELGDERTGNGVVTLTDGQGKLGSGSVPAASYSVGGTWRLASRGRDSMGRGDLDLTLRAAKTAHPLTRAVLARSLPEQLIDDLHRLDPSGPIDAKLHLYWQPGEKIASSGEVFPGAVEITRDGRRVLIERRAGALLLRPNQRPTGGRFADLQLAIGSQEPKPMITLTGGWDSSAAQGGKLDLHLLLEAPRGLDQDVRAMLPAPIAVALSSVSVECDQPIDARLDPLVVSWSPTQEVTYELDGQAAVRGASALVGTAITDLDGVVRFHSLSKPRTPTGVGFEVNIEADRMKVAGIRATRGRVSINEGNADEVLAVPEIRAAVHGGRLVGVASLERPEPQGIDPENLSGRPAPARFEADVRLASVAFAEVLEDLRIKTDQPETEQPQGTEEPGMRDRSRGLMDARIGLGGVVGDRSTLTGQGSVVIGGGRVLDLPLVLRLIQVSNLEAPSDEPIDMAEATFVVQGDRAKFEKLSVYTPSIEIAGHGTMRWTDQDLDLRFSSRRVTRIPILSEALERFRDELVQTRVSGVLSAPKVSLAQFSGTRKLFARLLGGGKDEAQRRLERARRLAQRRDRIRRVDEQASRFLSTSPSQGPSAPSPKPATSNP